MFRLSFCSLALISMLTSIQSAYGTDTFRTYIKSEPRTLVLQDFNYAEQGFLIENLFRGLTRYSDDGQLVFDQAQKCSYKNPLLVNCKIRKDAIWSDGQTVKASEFVETFRNLLARKSKYKNIEILLGIKNTQVVQGSNNSEIEFSLIHEDREFFEKLSDPMLVPTRAKGNGSNFVFNGPFKLKAWNKGKSIILESNAFYSVKNSQRPDVEFLILNNDEKALSLFRDKKLDFLWDLKERPAEEFKSSVIEKKISNLDYVGFNYSKGKYFESLDTRNSFVNLLSQMEPLNSLFELGCPGLGEFILVNEGHCLDAKIAATDKSTPAPRPLVFKNFSGESYLLKFQEDFLKFLRVRSYSVTVEQTRKGKAEGDDLPDIFLRHIDLNRPTCLAALEQLEADKFDALRVKNLRFSKLLEGLERQKMSLSERQGVCGVATDLIFKEEKVAFPLGRKKVWLLVNPQFNGWNLNELNQLDLSELKRGASK